MFNIENLDTESKQEAGAWLHLIDPATGKLAYADKDKKLPCRIKFKGWHSQSGKELSVKGRNKLMKAAVNQGKGNEPKELTIADLEENAETDAQALTELVITWENIPGHDGELVEFSKEAFHNAAIRLLDLRRQALEHLKDQKAFFNA